jgi:hypothetical protein
MICAFEGCGKKKSVSVLRYSSDIHVDGLRKTMKYVGKSVARPEFEPGTFQIQIRTIIIYANVFLTKIVAPRLNALLCKKF